MKSYERIYNLLTEISDKDLEHYKGRPSRKKAKLPSGLEAAANLGKGLSIRKKEHSRASKATKAAANRAKKKEAEANTKSLKGGTYKQQRGKQ